jgi:hypothetical protein
LQEKMSELNLPDRLRARNGSKHQDKYDPLHRPNLRNISAYLPRASAKAHKMIKKYLLPGRVPKQLDLVGVEAEGTVTRDAPGDEQEDGYLLHRPEKMGVCLQRGFERIFKPGFRIALDGCFSDEVSQKTHEFLGVVLLCLFCYWSVIEVCHRKILVGCSPPPLYWK